MTRAARRPRESRKRERGKASSRPTALSISPLLSAALVSLAVAYSALIRMRLLSFPLERDEGEYAYAGQLMLHGIPPYTLAYNMKFPGIYGAYALLQALFGATTSGIHLGLIFVNAATIVLVFALGKRLCGAWAGVLAAGAYAVLSTSESVMGLAAHATHFVVLPALGGALLLLRSEERPRAWLDALAGVLLGLALLMKQHGAVFVALGLLYVGTAPLRRSDASWAKTAARVAALAVGAALPLALTCLLLLSAGAFDRFWFWTVSYAHAYVSEVTPRMAWRHFSSGFGRVVAPAIWLWFVAGLGLVAAWLDRPRRSGALFLSGLLAFSALGVCPGLYFREHYFILVLPAIAILVGAAGAAAARAIADARAPAALCYALSSLVLVVPSGLSVENQKALLFELQPEEACRETYGANPFPEAIEISRYIEAHSKPSDRVAVLGSEPEIYFYSHRKSATGHIYMYGLMEHQPYARRMQEEMIRDLEATRPEYIVFVRISASWLSTKTSERLVLDWAARHLPAEFQMVGIVDVPDVGRAEYRWDRDAQAFTPKSTNVITVFRRRTPA